MLASLDEYRQTAEYEVLTQVPIRQGKFVEAMEKRINQAFESAYNRGRASAKNDSAKA